MISIPRTAILVGLLLSLTNRAMGEIITFNVNVTQTSINLGQSVDWQIFATVSGSTASNFGIASIAASLTDSFGNTLTAGSIGTPFTDYSFTTGGTWDGASLTEIAAVLFAQNNAVVEASNTGGNLGPLLFASGSYTPTTAGLHTLSATAGSANTFFTAIGQTFGVGDVAFTTAFNSDTFTVNAAAVPEPSTLLFLSAATLIAGTRYGRSLKKSNRSPSSRSGE